MVLKSFGGSDKSSLRRRDSTTLKLADCGVDEAGVCVTNASPDEKKFDSNSSYKKSAVESERNSIKFGNLSHLKT